MIEIIPGINEKSFDKIRHQIDSVTGLVDWIQIDVLDNTLIDIDTYNNWPDFKVFSDKINLEAHLMVRDPIKYIDPLVSNDFKRLIAHVEGNGIRDFIAECRTHEVEVGLALDGPSEFGLLEPYLDDIDTVLIMMYQAGKSGQELNTDNLIKIKAIHDAYSVLPIEVDGGIDDHTAPLVIENGATRLVSTSYLFWKNAEDITSAIRKLQGT